MYYLVDIHQYNTEIPHNNFVSFRFITTKLCLGNIICNWRSAHLKDEYYPFTPPLDLASVTSNKINYFSHKLSFLVFPRENHYFSSRIFLYCCCLKTCSQFQTALRVTWAISNEHYFTEITVIICCEKIVIQLAQLTGNPGWKISEVGEETIFPSIDFKWRGIYSVWNTKIIKNKFQPVQKLILALRLLLRLNWLI